MSATTVPNPVAAASPSGAPRVKKAAGSNNGARPAGQGRTQGSPKPAGARKPSDKTNGAPNGSTGRNGDRRAPKANNGAAPRRAGAPRASAGGKATVSGQDSQKIASLQEWTGNYYTEETLLDALRTAGGDERAALENLNKRKQSSWSNVVAQGKPFIATAAAAAAAAAAAPAPAPAAAPVAGKSATPSRKAPAAAASAAPVAAPAPAPAPAPEPEVDPEQRIQELNRQVESSLKVAESRTQALKTMQEEINSISGPRDQALDQLSAERSSLVARQSEIKQESVRIDRRLAEIDADYRRIHQEKVDLMAATYSRNRELIESSK